MRIFDKKSTINANFDHFFSVSLAGQGISNRPDRQPVPVYLTDFYLWYVFT